MATIARKQNNPPALQARILKILACRFVYIIQEVGRSSTIALTSFDIFRYGKDM